MTDRYEQIKDRIYTRILKQIDFSRDVGDEKVQQLIDEEILRFSGSGMTLERMKELRQELFSAIRRLDVLQELIDKPGVTEIMINGPDHIFVEQNGRIGRWDGRFSSGEKLSAVIQQVVAACNRTVNESEPIADARLSNGARVNIVLPPVSLDGPAVTIRRFPEEPVTMKDLERFGSIPPDAAAFLKKLVASGYNIFISGGTGCGKTTFLNALSDFIPAEERVITIEDNAELQIRHIPNIVRLEARGANVEGRGEIPIRALIRTSLRMRPDRIIVGEVRGGEAVDMLQAMNTGHDGSMSTGHANSSADMLRRLETMVLMAGLDLPLAAVRSQIASGIDVLVHLGRLRDRSRKLLEISEIAGIRDNEICLRTLCRFCETGEENGKIRGEWVWENRLQNDEKCRRAGIVP